MVVDTLLESVPAEQLAVSVRVPEKAKALTARGIDVRHGHFEDPTSLDTAFAGVDRLLIVSTMGDNGTGKHQHLAAVAATKRAGVGFIAYTSLIGADPSTIGLADVHRASEAAIRDPGIPYSLLRNSWYMENEAGTVQGAIAGAPVSTSARQSRVGWATRNDLAEAAAVVLAGEGPDNTTYELAGSARTYCEFASALGEALGREVPVAHVNDATYRSVLSSTTEAIPLRSRSSRRSMFRSTPPGTSSAVM